MPAQAVTSVKCPNCGAPFTTPIRQVIDAQADPEAKSRLLSGQLNVAVCPQCGFRGALDSPFIYHDAELELALVYMPMEVGRTDAERQKAIGDMTNRLMQQLPPEARKGYLLQPQTFLSMQTLIDALLEKDEETRELVESQQLRMELVEKLRELDPEDSLALAQFIGENDKDLDVAFFQLLDIFISIAESRDQAVEQARLERHREKLLEKTSTGRLIKAQQAAVEALAESPTRETLVDQLVAAEHKEVRETLVAVGRQMLDYGFFQALTSRIEAADRAGDSATRERLIALRKEVQEIRDEVDAMALAVMDARAMLIRELMITENPRELLMDRIIEVDNAFFNVLTSNIRAAENAGRSDVVQQLRQLGDLAVHVLNEAAPPEIKLINQLAGAESDERVRQILEESRTLLDQDFLEMLEDTIEGLQQGGGANRVERLRSAAQHVKELIAT